MDKLKLTFKVEKDTKNTRRYQEETSDGPPIIGTLYVQQWALRKLTGGDLPERVRVTVTVVSETRGGPPMVELTWAGKYTPDGKHTAPLWVQLPFQTVETVNESAQER